jgi:hypothetical protein
MEVLAKFTDVIAIMVDDLIPETEGSEEPKVVIEAVKDWGTWDYSMGEQGHEGGISHFVEVDFDASVRLRDLDIVSVSRIQNGMCIYLAYPVDIGIVDTEELLPVPFDTEAPPLNDILICSWESLQGCMPEDYWTDAQAVNC